MLCSFIAKVPRTCLLMIDELLKAITTTALKVHWHCESSTEYINGCVVGMKVVINKVIM